MKPPQNLPAPDAPLWNSVAFGAWDRLMEKHGKSCRYDGTHADYWSYLRWLETNVFSSMNGNGAACRVGPDSSVRIPALLLQSVNARYFLRQAGEPAYYVLTPDTIDALQSTELQWIDAEAFARIPDAMGLILPEPGNSLTLYANDVPDKFGNDFSVKPRLSKELKEEFKSADKKLPFVGNAKIQEAYDPSKYSKPSTPIKNAKAGVDDPLPF